MTQVCPALLQIVYAVLSPLLSVTALEYGNFLRSRRSCLVLSGVDGFLVC